MEKSGEVAITRRLEEVLDALGDEFKAMYCMEDFQQKLNALQWAPMSRKPELYHSLYAMFEQCGVPCEKNRENAYYRRLAEQCGFPLDSAALEERMLLALYKSFREYPSPEDYMRRIVDRLSRREDGWDADSLRMRILKQFIKYGNYLAEYLLRVKAGGKRVYYGGRGAIRSYVREKLRLEKDPSDEEVLRALDEGIFSKLEGAKKADTDPEGRYGLLKLADDLAAGKFRAGGNTKRGLYLFAMAFDMTYYGGATGTGEILLYESDIEKNLFQDYYTNNLARYLMDAYRKKNTAFEADPSGQGINYKNFMEMIYIYYISGNLPPREKLKRASRMIWDVQRIQKEQPTEDSRKQDGSTFAYRSRFAKLYEEDILQMTEEDFQRFILDNYRCAPSNGLGAMQLGREQRTAFSFYGELLKRIEKAKKPLEECNYGLWFTDVAQFEKEEEPAEVPKAKRARRSSEVPEAEASEAPEPKPAEVPEAKPAEVPKAKRTRLPAGIPETERESFQQFLILLKAANRFLGHSVREKASRETDTEKNRHEWTETSKARIKALSLTSPADMTRTALIVAFYYCYNAEHDPDEYDEKRHDESRRNFEEVFNEFRKELDEPFRNAGYQPFSGKNLFDVYVAFSSYAYLNLG